jgi:hypothetical protein
MQERRGRDAAGGRADVSLSEQRAGAGPAPGKQTLVEGLHASGGGASPCRVRAWEQRTPPAGRAAGAANRGVGGKRRTADGDRLRRLFGRERDIFEAQRPILTVDRGGTAPNFVTVINTAHASAIGEDDGEAYGYDYDYEVRAFHAVSALEYDVAHAHTAGQLASIYDSWFGAAMGFGGRLWNVSIPSGTDLRMQLMPFFMPARRGPRRLRNLRWPSLL